MDVLTPSKELSHFGLELSLPLFITLFWCEQPPFAFHRELKQKATFGPIKGLEPIFTGAAEDEQNIIENIHLVFLCH